MNSLPPIEVNESIDTLSVIQLLQQLHSFEPGVREMALETLLGLPQAPLIEVLSKIITGTDPELRCDAAEMLLRIDAKQTIPLVLPLLGDPDRTVRWNTCGLLHDWGDGRATEGLVKLLREDADAGTRHIAAYALSACGNSRALSALEVAAATDEGEDYAGHSVSVAAADAFFKIKARAGQ